MIILALFLPWLAIGLEFGFGKELAISAVLSFAMPVALFLTGKQALMIVANVVSLLGCVYAIYKLCLRRYEPVSQDAEDAVQSPPSYNETELSTVVETSSAPAPAK